MNKNNIIKYFRYVKTDKNKQWTIYAEVKNNKEVLNITNLPAGITKSSTL